MKWISLKKKSPSKEKHFKEYLIRLVHNDSCRCNCSGEFLQYMLSDFIDGEFEFLSQSDCCFPIVSHWLDIQDPEEDKS